MVTGNGGGLQGAMPDGVWKYDWGAEQSPKDAPAYDRFYEQW